jgi:hypothetical protein
LAASKGAQASGDCRVDDRTIQPPIDELLSRIKSHFYGFIIKL